MLSFSNSSGQRLGVSEAVLPQQPAAASAVLWNPVAQSDIPWWLLDAGHSLSYQGFPVLPALVRCRRYMISWDAVSPGIWEPNRIFHSVASPPRDGIIDHLISTIDHHAGAGNPSRTLRNPFSCCQPPGQHEGALAWCGAWQEQEYWRLKDDGF